jgi:hypothetical protein
MAGHCDDGEGCQIFSTYEDFNYDLEGGVKCVILTEIASHCQLACERRANTVSRVANFCGWQKHPFFVGFSFYFASIELE